MRIQLSFRHRQLQIRLLGLIAGILLPLVITPHASSQILSPAKELALLRTMGQQLSIPNDQLTADRIRYIKAHLEKLGVFYQVHNFDAPNSFTEASSLVAVVPGGSEETLYLLVPLNYAGNDLPEHDGTVAIITALYLVEQASRSPLPLTLQVVFMNSDFPAPYSSNSDNTTLVPKDALREPSAVVSLKLDTVPELVVVRTDGLLQQTPLWLLRATAAAIDHAGLHFTAHSTLNQLARFGLSRGSLIIDPYLASGYPAIELTGRNLPSRTATLNQWIEDFSTFAWSLSDLVLAQSSRDWERHYLFGQWGGLHLDLDEIKIVMLVATALLIALVLAFFGPRRLRSFWRSAWILPLSALVIYVALSAATVLLSALVVVGDLPPLWRRLPLLAVVFKSSTTMMLILVIAKIAPQALSAWHRIPVLNTAPKNDHGGPLEAGLLSAGAATVLPIEIAAMYAIDPAVCIPLIFSYAATLLFSLARLRVIKVVCLVMAIAPPAAVIADLVRSGADRLLGILLVSPRISTAIVTFLILPYILMALRLTLRLSEPLSAWGTPRRLSTLILMMALLSATTGVALFSNSSA